MNVIIKENALNTEGLQLYFHYDGKEWVKKWETKADAFSAESESHIQEIEPVRNQVLEGKLSPLAYHIEVHFFDLKLLSAYSGIPKRHIKKHLKPEHFNKLDNEILQKYAMAFGISVEELKKI